MASVNHFWGRPVSGLLVVLILCVGCGRFEPRETREIVYVWRKETYLRDRVAVVSNRVAEVANGQRLQVLEHGHRFLKVKTDRGEVGWIEDHDVIDQKIYEHFAQLQADHVRDPVVATGVLLDEYFLRDDPGRQSDRFYLLPENDKLQMLVRASVPKPATPQGVPVPLKSGAAAGPPAPVLEDYWLVRDTTGKVGWVRGRMLDEDVPDAIAGLAEGQKIVGAYVLRTVDDPDANVPDDKVAEYVTFLAPWKDGLPYDFNQVRVFTWNTKKHRYETAFRDREIAGFLPASVGKQMVGPQQEPVFSYRVATTGDVALDPQTGMVKPADTVTESFRMEGVVVHRMAGEAASQSAMAGNTPDRHDKARKHRRG
jgi:hypothetical protein